MLVLQQAQLTVRLRQLSPVGALAQGNLSDAEHEALQARDAAEMQAAQEADTTVRVDVHLYDPGELHGPMHLHLPVSATLGYLKREIERLSGVSVRAPGHGWLSAQDACTSI